MVFHGWERKNYVFRSICENLTHVFPKFGPCYFPTQKDLCFFFVCVSSLYVSIDIMRKSYARFFRNLVRVIFHAKGLVFFLVWNTFSTQRKKLCQSRMTLRLMMHNHRSHTSEEVNTHKPSKEPDANIFSCRPTRHTSTKVSAPFAPPNKVTQDDTDVELKKQY
jgi:hypothetical protein